MAFLVKSFIFCKIQPIEEIVVIFAFMLHPVANQLIPQVNKMPTFELIFPRNFLEVNYSSLKLDQKMDNFPQKSEKRENFQLSMIFLG